MDKSDTKKIKVSFCPKCRSNNVKYVFGFGNLFGVMPKMKCMDCGYSDNGFPILVTNKEEINNAKKKLKRRNVKKNKSKIVKKKVIKKIKKGAKK